MITKDLKGTKGITLISLVVSIVVILILAGVSIVTLTGENGILSQSKNASNKTKLAEIEEQANLIYSDSVIENKVYNKSLADLYDICAELELRGYTTKTDSTGQEAIKGIKTNLTPDLTDTEPTKDTFTFTSDDTSTQTKTIILSKDSTLSNETKYYVVIDGKDYEITLINGMINISRTPTIGISNIGAILTLKVPIVTGDDILNVTLSGNSVIITKKPGAISGTAIITITGTINGTDYTKIAKLSIKSYASNDSKVGYYADVNGDGVIDGMIYADLAVGNTNTSGNNGKGTGLGVEYSIPIVTTGLKSYEIETDLQNREYLKAVTSGIDRFYVVALQNFDSSYHTWYGNAKGKMNDYSSTTSIAFGQGKANTENMIKQAINDSDTVEYGELVSTDIWYLFTGASDNWTSNMKSWWLSDGYNAIANHPSGDDGHSWGTLLEDGWYVPSVEEFAAMKGELGNNTSSASLTNSVWTSSAWSNGYASYAAFNSGSILSRGVGGEYNVKGYIYARLGITF